VTLQTIKSHFKRVVFLQIYLNNPEKEKARKERYANEHKEERKEYMEKYREEKAE